MDDLYATVTQKIVTALERGTPPWIRPWSEVPEAMPRNAQTLRPYRGVNFTLLSLQAAEQGYGLNRWLTYRQASEVGGQVRRGEHGTPVVFWKLRKVAATAEAFPDTNLPDLPERVYPLLRGYTVFNVAQIDGLPEGWTTVEPARWEPEARAEDLLLMSGAHLRHGGSKAFYHPADDLIQLPPRTAFPQAAGYYNVALHELTHWTGHPDRCRRILGQRFGGAAYAAEELIAEMGAAYLCAHCRIDGELRHESYLASWLQVLQADKRAILVAAALAQKAADYVLTRADPTRAEALAA